MENFRFETEEWRKLVHWHDEHRKTCRAHLKGAIGGSITYSFAPTTLGVVKKISCTCGAEIDVTDYSEW